jgi:hypothetical protein
MGVTTTADEKLDAAREDIKSAIKNLHDFLDPDTWGHGDYKREYQKEVLEIYKKLLDIRDEL